MTRLTFGVDLRVLPADGSPGSGIPQVSRLLWEALVPRANAYGINLIGFVQTGADVPFSEQIQKVPAGGFSLKQEQRKHHLDGWIVPAGAVSPWLSGRIYPWVHDVAIFKHPEWFPQSTLKRWLTTNLFLRGLKQAKHIFSVSEMTKKDLQEQFGFASEKITATGQGITLLNDTTQSWPKSVPPDVEYILALGTVEPRKNLPFLLNVWKKVKKQLPSSYRLVIAGGEGWGERLEIPDQSVIRVTSFDNREKEALLANATLVTVPSLYEGFGRVALEAMAYGKPTLVSDRGSLPEVVCHGGLVLPLEEDKWAAAILNLATNEAERTRLQGYALRQASHWSWSDTAELILARIQADC